MMSTNTLSNGFFEISRLNHNNEELLIVQELIAFVLFSRTYSLISIVREYPMKTRSSPHLSVTILITVSSALLAMLGSILGNIATSSIPAFLLPYVRFAWPALGVIFVLGLAVSIWQVRRDTTLSSASSPTKPSLPAASSPAPVLTAQSTSASQYHSCILSYATEDQSFAKKLYTEVPTG